MSNVKCVYCKREFPIECLKKARVIWNDNEEEWINNICPKCSGSNCIDLTFNFKPAGEYSIYKYKIPPSWLLDACVEYKLGSKDRALDIIYNTFDDKLLAGYLDEVDADLQNINVVEVPVLLLVGILTITFVFHSKLPYRGKLFQDINDELKRRNQLEPGLLDGLEGK